MEEFPGNTNKDKDTARSRPQQPKAKVEKKVQQIVKSDATVVKPSFGSRFKDTFLGGEFRSAKTYIFMDVVLPALRNLVVDMTSKGVERLIYGETRRSRSLDVNRPRVQYHSPTSRFAPSSGPMLPEQPPLTRQRRPIGEVKLAIKEEADAVLEQMKDIVDQYQVVSVADLYEMCGLPTNYTDNDWGWYSLVPSSVRQARDGWLIDLPPVVNIK